MRLSLGAETPFVTSATGWEPHPEWFTDTLKLGFDVRASLHSDMSISLSDTLDDVWHAVEEVVLETHAE